MLLPPFLSPGSPPLVEAPKSPPTKSGITPAAIDSFLRLQPVKAGEGLLGMVWEKREPVFLSSNDDDSRLENLKSSTQQIDSVMVAPLLYGKQNLGVLASSHGPMRTPFAPPAFIVFQSRL